MAKQRRYPSIREQVHAADREYFERNPRERFLVRRYHPGELGAFRLPMPIARVVIEHLGGGVRKASYEYDPRDRRSSEPLGTDQEILARINETDTVTLE